MLVQVFPRLYNYIVTSVPLRKNVYFNLIFMCLTNLLNVCLCAVRSWNVEVDSLRVLGTKPGWALC